MGTKIEWADVTINPLQDTRKGKTGAPGERRVGE